MTKCEPVLIAELLVEQWKLNRRTRQYPEEWTEGFLSPVYKKGKNDDPKNYRPLCMLSCLRKTVESAISIGISRKLKFFGRQFGLQKGLSATTTLMDVDAVVKSCNNRVATLDMAKAYDKLIRSVLVQDCKKGLSPNLAKMIMACLQPLVVTTKGEGYR